MQIEHNFYGDISSGDNLPVYGWGITITLGGVVYEAVIVQRCMNPIDYYSYCVLHTPQYGTLHIGYGCYHNTVKYILRTIINGLQVGWQVVGPNGHVKCVLPLPKELCTEDLACCARMGRLCNDNPSSIDATYTFYMECTLEYSRRLHKKSKKLKFHCF